MYDTMAKADPFPKRGSRPYWMAQVAGYQAFVELGSAGANAVAFRVTSLPAMGNLATLPVNAISGHVPSAADVKKQIGTILASAYCDRIACVLAGEKKVVLYPLGLKSGAAGSGFAEAGKHFERKLNIAAGSTVTLQSGPQGLKYDARSSSLVWDVPADTKGGQMIQVIILVKDADAKENYLVEKISVP
jgi:hypothetical protein